MSNRNRKARYIGPKLRQQTPPSRPDWGRTTPEQFAARQSKAPTAHATYTASPFDHVPTYDFNASK